MDGLVNDPGPPCVTKSPLHFWRQRLLDGIAWFASKGSISTHFGIRQIFRSKGILNYSRQSGSLFSKSFQTEHARRAEQSLPKDSLGPVMMVIHFGTQIFILSLCFHTLLLWLPRNF